MEECVNCKILNDVIIGLKADIRILERRNKFLVDRIRYIQNHPYSKYANGGK